MWGQAIFMMEKNNIVYLKCKNMLKSKEILEYHSKMHSWDHKFVCFECWKTSSTPNDINYHIQKVHKESSDDDETNAMMTESPYVTVGVT